MATDLNKNAREEVKKVYQLSDLQLDQIEGQIKLGLTFRDALRILSISPDLEPAPPESKQTMDQLIRASIGRSNG